jgi:hypothetical protein
MNDLNISQETNLFDYIGVSMWSINELLLNDFKNLCDINEYKKYKILNNDFNEIIIHEKYYLRFLHDFKNNKSEEEKKIFLNTSDPNNKKFYMNRIIQFDLMEELKNKFPTFKSTLERRIERLKKILSTEKNIIFIRLEEENNERIIYEIYKEKFKKSELENIIEFSNIIKKLYPILNFKIIYISKKHENNYY